MPAIVHENLFHRQTVFLWSTIYLYALRFMLYIIYPFAVYSTHGEYTCIHGRINIHKLLSLVFCNVSIDISDKRNVESFERIRWISWDFMPVRQAIFPLLCDTFVFHEHCERKCVLAEFQRSSLQLRPALYFIIIWITNIARFFKTPFLNRFLVCISSSWNQLSTTPNVV